ncbi:CoA ester lyase [Sphingobium aromaticivastans]|uniref:HpcH/HpaI aldolase/citrate lyase family protein n=1 Tax=Sphingobium aromaticivastans TaxID=1778665 RepID=UPI00301ACC54
MTNAFERAVTARSWLFVPGDQPKKMEKAFNSEADIVLIDLEDAVAEAEKAAARSVVRDFIANAGAGRARLWVRINPIQGPHALADLAAVMPSRPGGIMLPKPRGRADVELLDHYLSALEAASGIPAGETRIIIVATETPEAMFATHSYAGISRLAAMTWGAEDIATAIGAIGNRDSEGRYDFTYQLARSLCLTGAAVAGVSAIETIHGDFRDEAGLEKLLDEVRRAGFTGMLAIHPAQVTAINRAFTPSPAEIEHAQAIVAIFAANPGVGAIAYEGGMLDLPYLTRARAVLARAGQA